MEMCKKAMSTYTEYVRHTFNEEHDTQLSVNHFQRTLETPYKDMRYLKNDSQGESCLILHENIIHNLVNATLLVTVCQIKWYMPWYVALWPPFVHTMRRNQTKFQNERVRRALRKFRKFSVMVKGEYSILSIGRYIASMPSFIDDLRWCIVVQRGSPNVTWISSGQSTSVQYGSNGQHECKETGTFNCKRSVTLLLSEHDNLSRNLGYFRWKHLQIQSVDKHTLKMMGKHFLHLWEIMKTYFNKFERFFIIIWNFRNHGKWLKITFQLFFEYAVKN